MSALERSKTAIPTFRKIISELRKSKGVLPRDSKEFRFLVDQMRGHQVTQKMHCKSPNEMEHLASTYASYLHSTRVLSQLHDRYKGNEKTVEESAHLVGLQVPEKNQWKL
uniref:Protein FMC1 homolog n=1 Tax=Panagrolaimus sp. JU765 TaxID=591449 RepID=A0AC34PUY9_9BILA